MGILSDMNGCQKKGVPALLDIFKPKAILHRFSNSFCVFVLPSRARCPTPRSKPPKSASPMLFPQTRPLLHDPATSLHLLLKQSRLLVRIPLPLFGETIIKPEIVMELRITAFVPYLASPVGILTQCTSAGISSRILVVGTASF